LSILIGKNGSGKTTIFRLLKAALDGDDPADERLLFGSPVCSEMSIYLTSGLGDFSISYIYDRASKEMPGFPSIVLVWNNEKIELGVETKYQTAFSFLQTFFDENSLPEGFSVDVDFISANRLFNSSAKNVLVGLYSSLVSYSRLPIAERKSLIDNFQPTNGGAVLSADFNFAVQYANAKFLKLSIPSDEDSLFGVDYGLLLFFSANPSDFKPSFFEEQLEAVIKNDLASSETTQYLDFLAKRVSSPCWKAAFAQSGMVLKAFRNLNYNATHANNGFLNVETGLLSTETLKFLEESISCRRFGLPRFLPSRLTGLFNCLQSIEHLNTIFSLGFPNPFRLSLCYHYLRGIFVKSEASLAEFDLDSLSSGQLNVLLMFFDFLKPQVTNVSSSPTNKLFLIDEPEISLHIEWQQSLVKQICLAMEATKAQTIIATHSPFIVPSPSYLAKVIEKTIND
jgi:energy-coupling factor transporter ATP-binding protein EcfA2